ncbi:MAG: peptidylprolyl isomerase [Pseudomonadota bacterium]|nr:peptidylprolyl isomerase [Pseudomonadota bacterium]
MLHLLRRAAKTWVFRILFGLLILSFAVWGVGDMDLGGGGTGVITVGEEKVSVEDYARALDREMRAVSQRTGQPIDIAAAQAMGLPQSVTARMVRDASLNEEVRRLGLSADDHAVRDAILASPSFQGLDGRFDEQQYRFVLERLGFPVDRFEDDLRKSLARDVLTGAVSRGAHAAPGYAERMVERAFETRAFRVAEFPADAVPAPAAPDDAALTAFHEANQDRYRAPETRAATWIEIAPASLSASVEVDEADIRAAYDAAGDRFAKPELRALDMLAFPDEAAAAEAAEAIAAGTTTLEALAEARGLTAADIDQGEVARDALDEAAAETVFGTDELGPVGPVDTLFGPTLYNIRGIVPARTTAFEAAAPELREELAMARARDQAHVRAEEAADLLASGATLEEIARDTGLPLRKADAIAADGTGAEGPLARDPAFLAEVFAAATGEERDLLEAGNGAYALVRVDAETPARDLPLDEVRDRVTADWTAQARIDAALAAAEAARERLGDGETWDAVAADLPAQPIDLPPLRRDQQVPGLPFDAIAPLFAAEEGATLALPTPDGAALVEVTQVIPADLASGQAADLLGRWRDALDGSVSQDLYTYFAAAVQERIGATLNPQAMDQAIGALR